MELNKIYKGDCLDIMSRISDGYCDMSITSPPYNIGKNRISAGFQKKQYNTINDNLKFEDYLENTHKWIGELLRVVKYHVFWNIQESTNNWGITDFIRSEFKDYLKEVFIWGKSNPPSCIVDTMCGHGFEYIFCLSHDNPQSRKFNYCDFSNRSGDYVNNIIIKPVNTNNEHPYGFGEWLPDFFITNFSKKGDIVIDPFMGSGTTATQCIKRGRNWIGSEISQEYIDLANKRLQPYLDQKTLF